jgi:hypothetical protein
VPSSDSLSFNLFNAGTRMTKSAMAKRLLRKLKEWENSKASIKMANEVLNVCEGAGMAPPVIWESRCGTDEYRDWTHEPKKRKTK